VYAAVHGCKKWGNHVSDEENLGKRERVGKGTH
jgi:hypothetical protein